MNELSATHPSPCVCARKAIHVCNTPPKVFRYHHRAFAIPRHVLHYRVRVRGLIYSRRFISGIRRRRRAICFMISPSPPLVSLLPLCRILFRDFAFCHIKFDCTTGTRCGDGQILKKLPGKFKSEVDGKGGSLSEWDNDLAMLWYGSFRAQSVDESKMLLNWFITSYRTLDSVFGF